MTIFVDTQHREGHSGDVVPALRRHIVPRSLIEETYLEFGDVMFTGNGPGGRAVSIGIEIKRVGDVLQCIEDGRFAGVGGQLEGMHRDYDFCWLVIEDDLRPDTSTGVLMRSIRTDTSQRRSARTGDNRVVRRASRHPRKASSARAVRWVPALFGPKRMTKYGDLMKWLTSVQVLSIETFGKPTFVWRTSSPDETAQWIAAQYQFWNDKKYDQHKSLRMFNSAGANQSQDGYRRKNRVGFISELRRQRAEIAARFDGIGFDKAMNLADRFGSIYEMITADVEQLTVPASVRKGKRAGDGVGKKLAEAMYHRIRQQDRGSNNRRKR